jgi:hypothetical protein
VSNTAESLPPGDQRLVDEAHATLGRVRRVTVRLRARWLRMDDLPPEDEASLKTALQAALNEWATEHRVGNLETEGPVVDVLKADPFTHLGL